MFHVVVFYVSYGLAFLQLLLSLFSDVVARTEFRRSDRERQPLLGRYTPVGGGDVRVGGRTTGAGSARNVWIV